MSPKPPSFWRRNALSLVFTGLTLGSLCGHGLSGQAAENHERLAHGLARLDLWQYLQTGAFASTLFENWESEFLQMLLLAGEPVDHGLWQHWLDSEFWFESFQNWQSEFFSITVLVLLSIYLREKDPAQSKQVSAPHSQTGE